jgi:hypothetical protein
VIFTPPLFALRASEPRSNAIRSIETSRVHHASWRRGSVAARGARGGRRNSLARDFDKNVHKLVLKAWPNF